MEDIKDDEISLLDLLVIIAENWVLLVLAPLTIGIVTYFVLINQPQILQSEAVIGLPPETIINFVETGLADDTLDPALSLAEAGGEGLSVSQGPNPQSSALVLISPDRDGRAALDGLVDDIVASVQAGAIITPRGELVSRIARIEETLVLRAGIIARLQAALADIEQDTPFDAEAYSATARALDHMLLGFTAEEDTIALLEVELAAFTSANVVISPPTGPSIQARSPILLAGLATLGAGFILLILVFIAAGLRGANDPESRQKITRIKNALLLRRSN